MKTIILIIVTCSMNLLVSCCSKLFPDEKLSMQRKDYIGNELRTDGYYYRQEKDYERIIVLFLFRNGLILTCGSYSSLDLNIVEREMIRYYDNWRKLKSSWGVFSITDDQILIEQWNAPTGISLPVIKRKGCLLNDTTFHITESYFSDINKTYYDEFVYHFKQFANKPDSTNYISSKWFEMLNLKPKWYWGFGYSGGGTLW